MEVLTLKQLDALTELLKGTEIGHNKSSVLHYFYAAVYGGLSPEERHLLDRVEKHHPHARNEFAVYLLHCPANRIYITASAYLPMSPDSIRRCCEYEED